MIGPLPMRLIHILLLDMLLAFNCHAIILQALEVTVWRDGKEYRQNYSRGKAITTLTSRTLSDESSSRQGTRIRFWPDKHSMLLFLHILSMVPLLVMFHSV